MSDRQIEWFIMITGPDEAADLSVLNGRDVKKLSKPGKTWI